ncbi:cation:proton antiporter [Candidatus Nitrospira inopinata]|uniref:Na(+)/H(+) antiporter NhaP n=1 Tax=Candidatus Nitrospira inopinata TaxID=1715989 RepID=A0A0S4KQP8_9BACT|nr:sodium:proton antiporter [Candidatus Nitrospira inopinata]MCP9464561.1 sodium:proton antiporter [Nitrospira sp.]CUQ65673.1 Na(+)/H(+) antiporter NhaP [Candidatus Nitrospira inopinata]
MPLIYTLTILICLAALFGYVNHRLLKLPMTIGLMAVALGCSLSLLALGKLGFGVGAEAQRLISAVDFNETLMHGMLGFLLFAGALHVKLEELLDLKWVIGTLATVGTLLSSAIIGLLGYVVFDWVGLPLPFLYCLLFGALISPTDPIAVMGVLRQARLPKALEMKIVGESLFNDGVGVVIFLVLLNLLPRETVHAADILWLFVEEAIGGAALGLALGYVAYRMLRSVDHDQVEILITLALVMGGFALADLLHTSGPIAVVVAGLLIGNYGRQWAMSETTRERLDSFWELLDELLNAVLFVLIGLEVLALSFQRSYLIAGLVAVPLVLAARWITVLLQVGGFSLVREFSDKTVRILTWGGLRGGISVALALSLPSGPERDAVVTITYVVVVFSILVQGLTISRVVGGSEGSSTATTSPT